MRSPLLALTLVVPAYLSASFGCNKSEPTVVANTEGCKLILAAIVDDDVEIEALGTKLEKVQESSDSRSRHYRAEVPLALANGDSRVSFTLRRGKETSTLVAEVGSLPGSPAARIEDGHCVGVAYQPASTYMDIQASGLVANGKVDEGTEFQIAASPAKSVRVQGRELELDGGRGHFKLDMDRLALEMPASAWSAKSYGTRVKLGAEVEIVFDDGAKERSTIDVEADVAYWEPRATKALTAVAEGKPIGSTGEGDAAPTAVLLDGSKLIGQPARLSEVDYIAVSDFEPKRSGSCDYNAGSARVYVDTTTVVLFDTSRGEKHAEKSFVGSRGACPEFWGGNTADGMDEIHFYPAEKTITDWVGAEIDKARAPKKTTARR